MPEVPHEDVEMRESIFPFDVYRRVRPDDSSKGKEESSQKPPSWKPWNRDGRPKGKKRYASFG